MARKTFDRYRDSETGRYVSRETWNRSHAHGGERFKRERVPLPEKHPKKLPSPEVIEKEIKREEEEKEIEFGGAMDYPSRS